MAKATKRAKARPVAKKRPARAAKQNTVIVTKRDIENVLARIVDCLLMMRQVLEAYDGKTDKAVLHVQVPKRVIVPPPFCFDCIPSRDPAGRGRRLRNS